MRDMKGFDLSSLYGMNKPKRQPVSRSQKNSSRIKQKGRCYRCHKVLSVEEHHHLKPVSQGGKSVTKNLVALCPECHRIIHIQERASKLDKKRKSNSNNPFRDIFG